MKSIVLCAILALSVSAFAEGEKKEENFAKRKTEMLEGIDKKIAAMQEHKTCVSAASDKDAMKKCHEKMKAFREENRGEHMGMRKERMEKRMER
ncbi:MAG: hypothetical protein KDD38_11515, partial [Bdellovibrionales bacterium]|nr:hypothetical protein [Bdellovibrionales bacterium]